MWKANVSGAADRLWDSCDPGNRTSVQECDANHYGMRGLAGDVGRNCPGEADLFTGRVRDPAPCK